MTLNIEFLAWDRYINVAGLNMLMGSTPFLLTGSPTMILIYCLFVDFLCFYLTFSNISAISWLPVLVVEETGVLGKNHRPWTRNW